MRWYTSRWSSLLGGESVFQGEVSAAGCVRPHNGFLILGFLHVVFLTGIGSVGIKWHRTTKSFHSDCILEFRNSIASGSRIVFPLRRIAEFHDWVARLGRQHSSRCFTLLISGRHSFCGTFIRNP